MNGIKNQFVDPGALASTENLCDGKLFVGPGALAGAAVSSTQNHVAAGALACRNLLRMCFRSASLLFATLREIFDESAYRRFLQRHQAAPSRASYAAFLREHSHFRTNRPRCC